MEKIKPINITISTLSNCLIGGAQDNYKIGGVDKCTAINSNGEPIITASSFKGVTRDLFINEVDYEDFSCVTDIYSSFFQEKYNEIKNMQRSDDTEKLLVDIEKIIHEVSVKYLFGVEGYSNSPKLMFSDLTVCENPDKDYFNIETKNTIKHEEINNEIQLSSNPRTYKTIKQGVKFKGEICFYKFNLFKHIGVSDEKTNQIVELIKQQLLKYNLGIYRLGNSKSRGYGKIKISVN